MEGEERRPPDRNNDELREFGETKLEQFLETYRDPEKRAEAERTGLLDSSPELMIIKTHPDVFEKEVIPMLSEETQEELKKPFPHEASGFGSAHHAEIMCRTQLIVPTLIKLEPSVIRKIGLRSFEKYMQEGKPDMAAEIAAVYFLTEKRAEAEAAAREKR